MIFVKINNALYPASITGNLMDGDWDNRSTKRITTVMDYATANALFVNNAQWSIVETDASGTNINEYDNSDYILAGDIIDHRDGTLTIVMGKLTDLEEAYELLLGGDEYDNKAKGNIDII